MYKNNTKGMPFEGICHPAAYIHKNFTILLPAYLRFFQVQKDASFQVPWCLRRQTNEKFKKKLKFPSSSNASKIITVRPCNIKRLLSSGKKERRQLKNVSGAHQQGRHDCHQTRTTDHAHVGQMQYSDHRPSHHSDY